MQKLRRQPLGFFFSRESGELTSSFAGDFANVEYTLCYWLPYPLGVGLLLVISCIWICAYDWRMGIAIFGMLPICSLLMLRIARVKEKHSRQVMEAKTKAATQLNEYLHGMEGSESLSSHRERLCCAEGSFLDSAQGVVKG
ncbi:MAG: ABC transporter transmembrane domain-containing protein [Clostridia bacterium]